MLSPDISTTTPVATYSLTSQRANSSLRSNAVRPLGEPRVLTVSHETQSNGRVNSVVYFDDVKNVIGTTGSTASSVRLQLKLQYNPTEGRTDIAATLTELYSSLKQILDSGTNLAKVLNKEH